MNDQVQELAAAKVALIEARAALAELHAHYRNLYSRYADRRTAAYMWEQRYWEVLGVDIDREGVER